ncbi:ABC transporter ATP-binding protein [Salinadaptatus halalkaliphilus]|uniref:ABC transporter ATP-binding protein n=1 Tax=Salinadaptatus halalkaliphilus TaxID=2419781 RepID=A0A4V3VLJ2_9EURY|nr:ABC transporter ATP-binding protein [Salinadaptatus halalkaliphilus]THE65897.1 ABC transporter ATP-binding protein [Salinadaptatus halalkaliphilus]
MSSKLTIENLHVRFDTGSETVHAVNGASFAIDPGEVVGVIGESGCGKSVTARSIVRLESPGDIVDGRIRYGDRELTTADDRTLRQLRGRELAMVFQDPSTTLNPVYPIGEQIAEALRIHRDPDRQPFFRELTRGLSSRLRSSSRRSDVLELMAAVGIPRPAARIDAYPHQFSGGMRQRAMLAVALARDPSVLIADEPTTALDTTTQAAILERLADLNADRGMGMLVISHDFGVVSTLCDRIVVMYDGVVVERGPTDELRSNPEHPYTKALLGCVPRRADSGSPLPTVAGTPPDTTAPPAGCAFVERCPFATDDCRETPPAVVDAGPDHTVRCDVSDAREASLEAMTTETPTGNGTGDMASQSQQMHPSSVAVDGGTGDPVSTGVAGDASNDDHEPIRPDEPVVELEGVAKSFRESDALVDRLLGTDDRMPAVRNVSLELRAGKTVGLVGESGCGKSTLASLVSGLEVPDEGTVRLRGRPVGGVGGRTSEQLADVGVVFQHPGGSLNPKRTVAESITEPLVEAGWSRSRRESRLEELCSLVGLPDGVGDRYPDQLSGGQRQRVAIARALALEPAVLVLDEPTAALDVSIQATVLNLLADLQAELGLAYLYVSHDLDAVRHVADRVAVMYCGRLVERGPAETTLTRPTHPYTQTLLDAVPGRNAELDERTLGAEPPSLADPPSGCAFHPRCPVATEECSQIDPDLEPTGNGCSRCLYAPEWRDESSAERPVDDDIA